MDSARLPPGPASRPLVGNLPEISRDPLGFLTRCAREYGDVVRLRLAHIPVFLLSHPDHIRYVLVTNSSNFIKDKGMRMRSMQRLFGNGLLTSHGDLWLRQRRLAQPAFHRRHIAAYGQVMSEQTERMLASWREGEVRDIHQEMMRLTLDIATRTLFGTDIGDRLEKAGAALDVITKRLVVQGGIFKFLSKFLPSPGRVRYLRAVRQLDEIIYAIIRERRSRALQDSSLLSMLLHAQDDDGGRMTDQQLRDEVMTMFLAGHETTALALSWTWYLLARHPAAEAKLAEELERVLCGRAPHADDLPRLTYTEMVVRESMRLYPPAWSVGREALHDCQVGGYEVARGTQVIISQWVMHRDPRFFESPEAFIPERWADDMLKRLPEFVYFPFGGGPRLCIGNSFAKMESVLLLAAIARGHRLPLVNGDTVAPAPSITLRPSGAVRVVVTRR
ncbi:MAG: cytochrome P450 [Pyrinomonadaceae bacterium]